MSLNLNEIITNRMIEQLEQGEIPWTRPWTGVRSGAFNRVSKKPYSLLNQMLLLNKGEYASYKQWSELGGQVRKGEKSEIVVFWKPVKVTEKQDDGTETEKIVPLLRYNPVFHISQVDGVDPLPEEELKEIETIDNIEEILQNYIKRENIKLDQTKSNEAYYSPVRDMIHLPLREQFSNSAEYYSTFAHEATHSTGHKDRLKRLGNSIRLAAFGSEDYSKEELVAELGSCMMLCQCGIETKNSFRNSAAYIQSWLKALRNDKRLIVSAAGKADKAVEFIIHGKKEVATA